MSIPVENLYEQAVFHRNTHDCSAYPYEDGARLVSVIQQYNPKLILEIGTGMGYTSVLMALAAPGSHIDTLEKDVKHVSVAQDFIAQNNLSGQITVINEEAEQYLENLNRQYDFIFFDGYQIHYEFLPHYERLLRRGGILFLANNHLKSKTSEQFFAELSDTSKWSTLYEFSETTVVRKI